MQVLGIRIDLGMTLGMGESPRTPDARTSGDSKNARPTEIVLDVETRYLLKGSAKRWTPVFANLVPAGASLLAELCKYLLCNSIRTLTAYHTWYQIQNFCDSVTLLPFLRTAGFPNAARVGNSPNYE